MGSVNSAPLDRAEMNKVWPGKSLAILLVYVLYPLGIECASRSFWGYYSGFYARRIKIL